MMLVLAYLTGFALLLIQTVWMWRIKRDDRDKCSFFAGISMLVTGGAWLLLLRYGFALDVTVTADALKWAFIGNYFVYRSVALAGLPISKRFTKWDLISFLMLGGLIGFVVLVPPTH